MAESARREHLIDTAIGLFAEQGYHATGIDMILARAGVSKKTLYRHFRSKDELIVAALRKHDRQFCETFMNQVRASSPSPRQQLLAVFDVSEAWFRDNQFHGCMFINAIGEYAETATPIREACQAFKETLRRFLEDLAREAEAEDPAGLARQLALLLEGAIVTAQVTEQPGLSAKTAKAVAEVLIAPLPKS